MSRDLISVIIPSYNHKEYLAVAIDSAIAQKSNFFDIEIIVIDDFSTDGSVEELNKFSKFHGVRTILNESNIGVSSSLNKAIFDYAKGDYIAILASDDVWEAGKIERQYAALKQSKCELAYTCSYKFTGYPFSRDFKKTSRYSTLCKLNSGFLLLFVNYICASSVMYKRSLLNKIGGYDFNMRIEDWDFLLRASKVTDFICTNQALVGYRIHKNNAMSSIRAQNFMGYEKSAVIKKNICSDNLFLGCFVILFHKIIEYIRKVL